MFLDVLLMLGTGPWRHMVYLTRARRVTVDVNNRAEGRAYIMGFAEIEA